jgi:hypothetical protein
MNHFVYVYYDQEVPFYVGMGKETRHLDHIRYAQRAIDTNAQRNKLSHKLNKIIKLLTEDRLPDIRIEYSGLTVEEARIKEQELIKKYGRADLGLGTLTNLTNGGDGVQGRTTMISPKGEHVSILKEDKEAYEAIGYIHFNKGRKHSEEVNKRKAAPWTGKTRPEHGKKIKEAAARGAFKGRKKCGSHAEETLVKMRMPKIKRSGYQNRQWYHSIQLCQEKCINTVPDWPDVKRGRLPKPPSFD